MSGPPTWLGRLKQLPTDWIIEKASPPLVQRYLVEVLGRPASDVHVASAREGSFNFKNALAISMKQQETGTWLDKILEFEVPNPGRKRGPGMVNQFLSLVEYGWDATHPIIHCSADRLIRYAQMDATADLFELKGYAGSNEASLNSIRLALSVISAAALSRAGYGDTPVVQEVAQRVLDQLDEQYPEDGSAPDLFDGEVEIDEESKDDGFYRILKDDHHCPDMFLYYLMAFHPLFHTERGRKVAGRVTAHLLKGDEIPFRLRECGTKRFLKLGDLQIGNWDEADFRQGRVSYLLHDLELLARTGTLAGNEKPERLLSWLLEFESPEDGVFRTDDLIEKHITRSQYHYFPLEDSWRGKHKKYTDLTFRVALILKILDETSPLS